MTGEGSQKLDRITHGEAAALQDLGVDAEFNMAVKRTKLCDWSSGWQ